MSLVKIGDKKRCQKIFGLKFDEIFRGAKERNLKIS